MCTTAQLAAAVFCGKPHTAPVIDRIATRNQRTTYKGEGICLGAWVSFNHLGKTITGQVWAPGKGSKNPRYAWWCVADGGLYWYKMGCELTLITQALTEDVPLFDEAVAS